MSIIKLSGSAATWQPSMNPSYGGGYTRKKVWQQPKDMSDNGSLYSYNYGALNQWSLHWPAMKSTDATSLVTFLESVSGNYYTFTLIDYDATTYTVRLTNQDSFTIRRIDSSLCEVLIEIQGTS